MEPTTLQEAVLYFADPANCREYMVPRRWADGIVLCPTCGSDRVKFQEQHNRWQCTNRHPRRQFTLKPEPSWKTPPWALISGWLPCGWLPVTANGISSWELHRALKITQ